MKGLTLPDTVCWICQRILNDAKEDHSLSHRACQVEYVRRQKLKLCVLCGKSPSKTMLCYCLDCAMLQLPEYKDYPVKDNG